MRKAFQKFVDGLNDTAHPAELRQVMADAVGALDLCRFAYLLVPGKATMSPLLISTYPRQWTDHYLDHQYERFDPVVIRFRSQPDPFVWGLGHIVRRASDVERELFEQAAKFGIRYGYTIPIHDTCGAIAAVTFATDKRRPHFERSIVQHAPALQLIAMYFHAHVRRKLIHSRRIGDVSLSPREFECLEWSSHGKSAWEIGGILGISRRTAAFHLDNARAKLGVRTVRQAVVRLAESRLKI